MNDIARQITSVGGHHNHENITEGVWWNMVDDAVNGDVDTYDNDAVDV